jgi:hypothetical protein
MQSLRPGSCQFVEHFGKRGQAWRDWSPVSSVSHFARHFPTVRGFDILAAACQ